MSRQCKLAFQYEYCWSCCLVVFEFVVEFSDFVFCRGLRKRKEVMVVSGLPLRGATLRARGRVLESMGGMHVDTCV